MDNRVKPWHTFPFRWIFGGAEAMRDHRRRLRRSTRQDAPVCEALEDRVVLSGRGDILAESLSSVGVLTGPVLIVNPPSSPSVNQSSQSSQLQTDLKTLQTELQSLAAKSGVTVADLTQLSSDEQAIASAGFRFDRQTLQTVVSELATAVSSGTSTAQAKTDFTALFSGSSVTQSVIDTTFNDLVQVIKDSTVTTTDLTTVSTDENAVQTDLNNLNGGYGLGAGGFAGGILAQTLTGVGVVTLPVTSGGRTIDPSSSQTTLVTQLNTDEQTLATELQTLSAKSEVTVADLTKLSSDEQTIAQDGYWFEGQNLSPVISELATAVSGGTSTAQAQADFTALFSGSTVPQSAIDATFNDLVQIIKDSGVTPIDLTTVAGDQSAIRTDLNNLGIGSTSNNGVGCGPGTANGTTASTGSTSSTSSTASTGSTSSTAGTTSTDTTASTVSADSTSSTTSTSSATNAGSTTSTPSTAHHHRLHARSHRKS
jgi:cell division protein FtsB